MVRTRFGGRPTSTVAVIATFTVVSLFGSAAVGCTRTRDVDLSDTTSTTIRRISDDRLADAGSVASAEAVGQVQALVNRLLGVDDPCAILNENAFQDYTLDGSSLASSAVRRALSSGVTAVYNHTINLIPQDDSTMIAALRVQRETLIDVLDVVDRYATNPTSNEAANQVRTLVTGEEFVKSAEVISLWLGSNCV